MRDEALALFAQRALDRATSAGAAQEAAVRVERARFVEVGRREGRVETLQASTTRGLSLALYVDGRYSTHGTSYLEVDALDDFVDEAVALTRRLAPDPHRALPDAELYGDTSDADLDLVDEANTALAASETLARVAAVEAGARAAGDGDLVSVAATMSSVSSESLRLHSNGFAGARRGTVHRLGATVVASDAEGRKPEESWWTAARHLGDLPDAAGIGAEAAARARMRVGSSRGRSRKTTVVVENRAAARLVGLSIGPLTGAALWQGRSCFADAAGRAIGAPTFDLADCPRLARGLGSRAFDRDGLPARARRIVEQGTLRDYFVDVYYGRKLDRAPTTGGPSNLVLTAGTRGLDDLIRAAGDGVLVTGFLGGNANPATGALSLGLRGFAIEGGVRGGPLGEMNLAGDLTDLWHRLVEVGNDPFPHRAWRIPSLLLTDVQVSGE